MEANAKTRASRKSKGKNKKKKKSTGKALKIMLILLALLLAGAGAFYYFVIHREQQRLEIVNGTTFHEGITVNDVSIGGMTISEAKAALASTAEKAIADSVHLQFTCNGKNYLADSSYFTITFDTEDILNEAIKTAREGDYKTLTAEVADIAASGRPYTISYTVEPTGIEPFIHSFADELTTQPIPASVAVKYPAAKEKTKAYDTMNLGIIGDAAKEAKLEENALITDIKDVFFTFTEATDGFGVDVEALMEQVKARCAKLDFGDIEVITAPIPSDITVETLKHSLVLRGSSSTTYKSKRRNAGRCHNLEKACGMVYGTVLQPGEQFSANGILGDRTFANGWEAAPAVISGGAAHEDQPGGGVCQIATTTYMSVLKSDLEVVFRRPHSTPSGYPDGLDATINTVTGDIDFKWTNNTTSPIYVFTWIDNVEYLVHCDIYGEAFPETFDEITLSSALVEKLEPGAPEYNPKSSLYAPYWMLQNDSVTGYVYESFKTYKLNGKEVDKKSIGNTTYKMHPTRYYVWPGWAGEPLQGAYQLKESDSAPGQLELADPSAAFDPAAIDPNAGGMIVQ